MKKPTPVFVVGKHRSGTTGLANHLCRHPEVACVQHQQHWGVHESGYFAYVEGRYGPLSHRSNYREFVEVMSASDYFRLAGIEKDYMLSLWPTTYFSFLETTMIKFAEQRKARYWLEKSPGHTKRVLQLAKKYPSARFVAIIRDVEDVVASSLSKLSNRKVSEYGIGARAIVLHRVVIGWVFYNKMIYALQRRYPFRTKTVRYKNFLESKESVLEDLCCFLEVDYIEDMCTLSYTRNSSFSSTRDRMKSMTAREKKYSQRLASVLTQIPHQVYWMLHRLYKQIYPKTPLPEWYFRLSDRNTELEK